jgi:hypothetical protein
MEEELKRALNEERQQRRALEERLQHGKLLKFYQ